uniref:Uncharacterized protein LOC111130957 n=1 Tax=Crassostrea virginica TaxID=6565 RepID=A0A8B8E3T6_CRAVI|nr:uncharacterized protein LOC111130957 [Crassostrea virginica]
MMAAFLLQLILIISSVIQLTEQECLQEFSTKCCADFYFDDGTCKPCKIGYFGPNCETKCPYPKYGRKCVDGNCNCSENQCDFAVGCTKDMPDTSSTPTSSMHLSSEKSLSQNRSTIMQTTAVQTTGLVMTSQERTEENTYESISSDLNKKDDKSDIILVVVLSSVSSLVVSLIVITMFACLRSRKSTKIRNKGNTSPYSGRAVSTASYHEIDDCLIAQDRSEGKYDKINNIEKETTEKHKYDTLPTKEGKCDKINNIEEETTEKHKYDTLPTKEGKYDKINNIEEETTEKHKYDTLPTKEGKYDKINHIEETTEKHKYDTLPTKEGKCDKINNIE